MDFDLSLLHSGVIDFISINKSYNLPDNYYKNTDILSLGEVSISGKICQKENEMDVLDDYMECIIEGNMIVADSISLEKINYPFTIRYDDFLPENCIKSKNTLDIFLFLWENIVLEVPLYFTKVKDISKFHGDGWRLIHEDELAKENNPFCDLLKDFEEE